MRPLRRCVLSVMFLLFWAAKGAYLSWRKGKYGQCIDWIGTTISVRPHHASQMRYAGSGHRCWVYPREAVFFKWVLGCPLVTQPFVRDLSVRTEASPWSMAGILHLEGVPHSWWAQEIDGNDLERMATIHDHAVWQQKWELPAFVVSVDLWRPLLATGAVASKQTPPQPLELLVVQLDALLL